VSKRDWRYYRERQRARGRGRRKEPENAREAVGALLEERLEHRGFPAALEVEAGRAADAAAESDIRRRDLTDLPTFTIDPATARDFDDAISARHEEDGVRIWVHIADVAAHVRPGT
jgi:ribonuclease R